MAQLNGEEYKQQLQLEKDNLDLSYVHTCRLLNAELERLQSGTDKNKTTEKFISIHHNKASRLAAKVILPIKEYPQINFSGRLLGPGGANLKALQELTGCKMSILGRGSMRDKAKEEELRQQGGKYDHLKEDLHVLVEVFTPLPEAYQYIGYALAEVRKYLAPDFDPSQALVPQPANGSGVARGAPRGRGAVPPRGRGIPPPRGAPPGLSPRGARGARGAPTRARGVPPPRGAMRGMRGGAAAAAMPPVAAYGQADAYSTGMEVEEDPYAAAAVGYEDQQYAGYESYDAGDASQLYQPAVDQSQQFYGDFSNEGAVDPWAAADTGYGKLPTPMAGRGNRAHPYAHARGTRGGRR